MLILFVLFGGARFKACLGVVCPLLRERMGKKKTGTAAQLASHLNRRRGGCDHERERESERAWWAHHTADGDDDWLGGWQ